MSKRAVIILKPRAGRRARAGAPWIFSNEIAAGGKILAPGSVVNVQGDDGQVLGSGFFNPKSLIAVRLFARTPDMSSTKAFFTERFTRALMLRERFYSRPYYRLVHAEGDGLPGLVIDRFDDILVLQITIAGMELALSELTAALRDLLNP